MPFSGQVFGSQEILCLPAGHDPSIPVHRELRLGQTIVRTGLVCKLNSQPPVVRKLQRSAVMQAGVAPGQHTMPVPEQQDPSEQHSAP